MTKSTDRSRSSSVSVTYKRRQGPGQRPRRAAATAATAVKPGFGLFGNNRRIQEALEQMQADMDAISAGKMPEIPASSESASANDSETKPS